MNSKKTPSSRIEKLRLEKYGMVIELTQRVAPVPKWDLVFRNLNGQALTREQAKVLTEQHLRINVDWERTDEMEEHTEIVRSRFFSEEVPDGAELVLVSVADGPILGVYLPEIEEEAKRRLSIAPMLTLLDPCNVVFDGTGRVNYIPIFGVERKLCLLVDALKSVAPVPEVLAEGYLGFAIQNQMFKFQLRPKVAFHQTEELETSENNNDA